MIHALLHRIIVALAVFAGAMPWIGFWASAHAEGLEVQSRAPVGRSTANAQDPAVALHSRNIAHLKNLKSVGISVDIWPKAEWQHKSADHIVRVLTSTISGELKSCRVKVVTDPNRFRAAFRSEAVLQFEVRLPESPTGAAVLSVCLEELTVIKRNGESVLSRTWVYNFDVEPMLSLKREVSELSELVEAVREASAGFRNDYSAGNLEKP